MKKFLLVECKTIAEYESKKEAVADKDNNELWYPESDYKVVEQEQE